MEEEQDLYWGMHFCNSSMFKTIARIQMYLAEQKEEYAASEKKHIKYYMTEYGQIFKFDKTNFISFELDLQNMYGFRIRILRGFILGNI